MHEALYVLIEQFAEPYSLRLRDEGDSVEINKLLISVAEPLVVGAVVGGIGCKSDAKPNCCAALYHKRMK